MNTFLQWLGYNDKAIADTLQLRRKRAFILTSVFSGLIITIDIFQNFASGFTELACIEAFILPLIAVNFILYRMSERHCKGHAMFMAFLLSFMILVSLIVEGYGMQIMLFWTAALPLILFLLLNLKMALIANAVVAAILGVMTLNSYAMVDTPAV